MIIKKLLLLNSKITRSLAKNISASDRRRNELLKKWKEANNDVNLRLHYSELDVDAIVFDLGGYKGDWASDIFSMYRCKVYVFEPHPVYYNNIKKRFLKNDQILIYEYGLGSKEEQISLSTEEDASSAFKGGNNQMKVQLKPFSDFLTHEKIDRIHLLKINIEGGEYDLLDHIIESDLAKKIDNFQIQFHHFVPHAEKRMKAIQDKLSKTHQATYHFNFFWENWEIKS